MRYVLAAVVVLATLATVKSGEYCDDFEDGDLGPFWTTSDLDSRGHWTASSYEDLKNTIPDFPAPTGGDTVAYLMPDSYQIYVYARLQMTDLYDFPAGSTISFKYWLRTDYPGSGTLEVRRQIGAVEEKEPFLSLTNTSGPNNTDWMEISSPIPDSKYKQKIIIFGACGNHAQNNIAVDDVKICGPQGLDQKCYPLATTTETPTSTEAYTTTETPTSTEGYTTTETPTSTEAYTTTETPTSTEAYTTTETPTSTEAYTTSETPTSTEAYTTTETPTSTDPSPTIQPSTSPAPPTPGEYCDDFEANDFGLFWHQSQFDTGGRWEPSSYLSLNETVPDMPTPSSGDTVVYLTLSPGSSFAAARLEMTADLVFPEGSSLSFRYWLRSQWPASSALFVKREMRQQEDRDPLLDLTETSGPENDQWMEASVVIPADDHPAKIIIFGSRGSEALDNIAIDDIRICGPQGLDHKCVPLNVSWN